MFITNAPIADLLLLFARTTEGVEPVRYLGVPPRGGCKGPHARQAARQDGTANLTHV